MQKKATKQDRSMFKELEGLPDPKIDCIELVMRTLKKAILKYEGSKSSSSCKGE